MLRILTILIAIYGTTSGSSPNGFTLELVQALFRHGDRTIEKYEIYPKDPYKASIYEPYGGYGQLTNKGKSREYQVGQMLRKQYDEFLGDSYKPDEVDAYSVDVDRSKVSLQLVLAGLYPPTPKQIWSQSIYWMPIPDNSRPSKYDFLSTINQCTEFDKLFNQAVALPEVQRKLYKYRSFIRYLSKHTGYPVDPNIGKTLHGTITAQMSLGLTAPSWCTAQVLDKLAGIAALTFDIYTYTDPLKKLVAGPTIKRFLNNIESNESKNNTKKIYLYSAHDSNVLGYIHSHGLQMPRLADYGSTVIFEKLRGNNSQIYVRLFLWPGFGEKLTSLKLRNCNEVCPLSQYLKIMDSVIPDGYGTECLYKSASENVPNLINGPLSNRPINKRQLKFL